MRPKNDSGFTGSIARYAFENLDLPLERWSCRCDAQVLPNSSDDSPIWPGKDREHYSRPSPANFPAANVARSGPPPGGLAAKYSQPCL